MEPTEPAQGSPEWFAARVGLVTGSAVGSILGLSPWSNRDDVMRRMVREALGAENEMQDNPPMAWGRSQEAGALLDFQMETGLTVEPASFVVLDDDPKWLGASPDGYIGDDALIEVKSPYSLRKGGEFKTLTEQPAYHAQIQTQLHCTGRKRCAFYQWAPHDTKLEWVDYDPTWIDENIPRLRQFHAEFLDIIASPDMAAEHLAPKRVVIDTPEAARMLREYMENKERAELLDERQKELLGDIVEKCGGKNALFAGAKVTQTNRKGSISYSKAIKALKIEADFEPFRGAGSSFWGITE